VSKNALGPRNEEHIALDNSFFKGRSKDVPVYI
jgi:hypothetical protein